MSVLFLMHFGEGWDVMGGRAIPGFLVFLFFSEMLRYEMSRKLLSSYSEMRLWFVSRA